MHYGGVGAGVEDAIDDDVPVALSMVLFEAQQRDSATVQELADVFESLGCSYGVEHLAVAVNGLGLTRTKPGAVVLRITQGAMVHVIDTRGVESSGEFRLRQPGLATEWRESYVYEDPDVLLDQLRDEVANGLALVADADQGPCCGGPRIVRVRDAHDPMVHYLRWRIGPNPGYVPLAVAW